MRVGYRWLKELVDVDLEPQVLADKMTMAGIAVEKVENLAQGLDRVVVGEIAAMEKHPNADKLWVCQVNVGSETRQIVTGAQNVKAGDRVPVALDGANLPNGVSIKPAKLRGISSNGMLCSISELNLDPADWPEEAREGILILEPNAPAGQDFAVYLGIDDYVLELELYPNRADCLGMINVAREVSAITGAKLRLPPWADGTETELPAGEKTVKVSIEDPELCRRYTGMLIEDVRIGESPVWMKQRLAAAGMRSISNLVDITNYVMLEMGQPLHAFDFDTLRGGEIIVRRAKEAEKLVTLDKAQRNLDESMLVIADREAPVGLAGVMGGLDSEVTEKTKTIMLEAAHFAGANIRRTSRSLGLRSEASLRFEKGVNAANLLAVQGRVAELVVQLGAGRPVGPVVDSYPVKVSPVSVNLNTARVNEVLGLNLEDDQIESILAPLGFKLEWMGQGLLQVHIPAYRADLNLEVDLIEEVARLHGFDKISTTLPSGNTTLGKRSVEQKLKLRTRRTLANCGFSEVINFSFTGPRALDRLGLVPEHPWRQEIKLMNPLRDELSLMRTSLIPGLLETAAKNVSRRNVDLALFELGYVFFPTDQEMKSLPVEEYKLAGLAMGVIPKAWNHPQTEMDFYFVKGALEYLLRDLGVDNYSFGAVTDMPFMHPGRTAAVIVRGKRAGFVGEIHPDVQESYELPGKAYIFELDGAQLFEAAGARAEFEQIPRFPAVTRDMALLVDVDIPVEKVYRSIRKAGGNLLREVRLFDLYQGAQVPVGKKSVAFSLVYQSGEKTLTDEEISALHDKIKKTLDQEFGAELRQ